MNEIIDDIYKLKTIQYSVDMYSRETIKSLIQDMIDAKEKIVDDYEKSLQNNSQCPWNVGYLWWYYHWDTQPKDYTKSLLVVFIA